MSPINIATFYEAASQIILGCQSMPEVVLAIFKCFLSDRFISHPFFLWRPNKLSAFSSRNMLNSQSLLQYCMICCRLRSWPVLKKKTLRSLQMATLLLASCTWCLASFCGSLLPSSVWSAPGLHWPSALWAIGNR